MEMTKSACPVTASVLSPAPQNMNDPFFEVATSLVPKETKGLVMIGSFLQLTILLVIHPRSGLSALLLHMRVLVAQEASLSVPNKELPIPGCRVLYWRHRNTTSGEAVQGKLPHWNAAMSFPIVYSNNA